MPPLKENSFYTQQSESVPSELANNESEPQHNQKTTDEPENSTPSTSNETKNQVKCSFQQKWLTLFPWLEFDEFDDKTQLLTCKICKDRGRKNAFTCGSANLKTSNMEDH